MGGGGHTLSRGDSKQGVTRVRHKHRKVAHHTDSPTRSPVGKGQSVRAGRHGQCNNPGRPPSREEATGQQGKSGARRTDNAKARGRHTSSGWSRRDVVSCELQDARQQRRGGGHAPRSHIAHRRNNGEGEVTTKGNRKVHIPPPPPLTQATRGQHQAQRQQLCWRLNISHASGGAG